MLPDGRSARAAGCGAAFLDGGCGYDLGTASWGVSRLVCVAWVRNRGWGRGGGAFLDGGCGYDLGTASILGPWHTRLGYLVTTKQL